MLLGYAMFLKESQMNIMRMTSRKIAGSQILSRGRRSAILTLVLAFLVIMAMSPVAAAGPTPDSSYNPQDMLPDGASGHQENGGDTHKLAYVDGQILVKFRDGVTQTTQANALRALGEARTVKQYKRNGVQLIHIPDHTSVEEALAILIANPRVEYAEPDYILRPTDITPNDPRLSDLWGLQNTGQTGGTSDADIDAPCAWISTMGSSDIVVAVIDTGVDYTHEDLATNMWQNPGEIPGNDLDDDGNGYVDDIYGIDTYNEDSDPMDDDSHGTHCAGTIGAVGDNGIGITGVAWDVEIMALKFIDGATGWGPTSAAIEALEYAIDMKQNHGVNVRITSNSWGGGDYSTALYEAIVDAAAADILFVAAAGNDSTDNDSTPHYPSSYDVPNVISVAASDHNDNLAYFSNYGATSVDLAAPGVNILSTVPSGIDPDRYSYMSGTSMATPHVSGVAALICSLNPDFRYDQVKQAILETVDTGVGDLSGMIATDGRLNACGAVRWTAPAGPDIVVTPPAFIVDAQEETTNELTLTIDNVGNANLTYTITETSSSAWLNEDPKTGSVTAGNSTAVTVTINTSGLALGDYDDEIVVSTNDPDENPVVVPVYLSVVCTPDISINPGSLDVVLPIDTVADYPLTISNNGCDVLNISYIHDIDMGILTPSETEELSYDDGTADIAYTWGGVKGG